MENKTEAGKRSYIKFNALNAGSGSTAKYNYQLALQGNMEVIWQVEYTTINWRRGSIGQ